MWMPQTFLRFDCRMHSTAVRGGCFPAGGASLAETGQEPRMARPQVQPVVTHDGRLGQLTGRPEQDFFARYREQKTRLSRGLDLIGVLAVLVSIWKHNQVEGVPFPTDGVIFLAAIAVGFAACVALPLLRGATPTSPYVRWLEGTAVVLRLFLFGLGPGWKLQARVLNTALPEPLGSSGPLHATIRAASATVQLLYASGAVSMAQILLCRPMRLSWSIAAQAILVANAAAWVPSQCGTAQLQAPALRRLTHLLYAALSPLRFVAPLPSPSASGLVASPGSAAECITLLRFVQLTLGLLVPLIWQAVTDAALFSTHQRQRAAAGLPLQGGFSARLYGAVNDMCHPVARPYAWLMAPMALGLCWQLAARTSLAR